MTLLEIEILFHYYTTPGDYRDGDLSAPAVREAIDNFLNHPDGALLKANANPALQGKYSTTERCQVYIDALRAVPLPVQQWVMP